jgi:acetoacetate decarboxylase
MSYPLPPWRLQGYALQTLQLVNIKQARPFYPSAVHPVPVLPGKTVGCVYFASYEQGSVVQYHELIISLLARYRHNIGFWISHIYVDDAHSMAGGRDIWGLPKELADFTWEISEQRSVQAAQNGQILCRLRFDRPRWLWRQPVLLPVVSVLGPDVLAFTARLHGQLGIAGGRLDVPAESPLAALHLGEAVRTYHYRNMHAVAQAPRVIGQTPRARPSTAANEAIHIANIRGCRAPVTSTRTERSLRSAASGASHRVYGAVRRSRHLLDRSSNKG